MDPDAIGSQYGEYPEGFGNLSLKCGNAAFTRLRDLICAEAKITDIDRAKIRYISIDDFHPDAPRRKTGPFEVAIGVGCALFWCLLVTVFGFGIHTIWRWLTGP